MGIPKNKYLWNRLPPTNSLSKRNKKTCFYTNFEVMKVSFFTKKSVKDFTREVSEKYPYPNFMSWGDANVRYITLAIFSEEREVNMSYDINYGHSWQCERLWL